MSFRLYRISGIDYKTSPNYFTAHLGSKIIDIGGAYMDVLKRIAQLRDERGWSNYKLAKETGVSQTTIGHMFTRNTQPNITTLESICEGFGITLSQFFSDGDGMVSLDGEQKELLAAWSTLPKEQKSTLLELLKKM